MFYKRPARSEHTNHLLRGKPTPQLTKKLRQDVYNYTQLRLKKNDCSKQNTQINPTAKHTSLNGKMNSFNIEYYEASKASKLQALPPAFLASQRLKTD